MHRVPIIVYAYSRVVLKTEQACRLLAGPTRASPATYIARRRQSGRNMPETRGKGRSTQMQISPMLYLQEYWVPQLHISPILYLQMRYISIIILFIMTDTSDTTPPPRRSKIGLRNKNAFDLPTSRSG